MTTGVKYTGTFTDYSGYGQANRNFITALFLANIKTTTELVVQVQERGKFGWIGELCKALENNLIRYKIKIIHLTPDMYPRYMEAGKYHIGHLFWETDRLPKTWVAPCNQMDEIWTASEKQAQMIKASGVKVPIYWFPQPVEVTAAYKNLTPYTLNGFNGFLFYSIFQWIERKNPKALVQAYWKAFSGKTDVGLLLKTYRVNYSPEENQLIKEDIYRWKQEVKLDHYPRIFMLKKLMATPDMFRLHATGDAYVTTTRGEGWCIPAVEAMLMGNPVIGLDKTGFADYMSEETYFPCKTKEEQVVQVPWIPWYTEEQNWLEISEPDLIKQMQWVYNNQIKAKEVGSKAREFVEENFNFWAVGAKMRERLEEIESKL